MASITDLESTLSCKDEVSYEPATKDVRITDALASIHDAKCVVQLTTFDEYGRVFQQFDDYRRTRERGRFVEARGQRLYYRAGQVYQKQEAREGDAGQIYYVAESEDSAGRITGYKKGYFSMVVGYDDRGNLNALGVNDASTYSYIQQHSYTFDALGNLTSRALTGEATPTTFGYDVLNRVVKVNGEDRYGYDANGNLKSKDGWTQKYGKAGEPLHAIYERVKGAQTETFRYDANGNQLSATVHLNGRTHTRTLDYNARNKVTQISQNGEVINFAYDANNRRYKRTEGSKTIYYVGALEIVAEGTGGGEFANQKYIRRSINGDAVQTYHPNGQASLQWLFTDHQGSVVAITDYAGKFLKRFKYDVFGKQSEIVRPPSSDASYTDWSTATLGIFTRVPANNRSYTGHEPITLGGDNRIIHMNGRVYDADTGRFMQADPFVQAPNNLQNYNAYSYVLNNPLSYTDPSGYIFKKLLKGAMKVTGTWQLLRAVGQVPWLNTMVTVGLNFIPGCQGWCAAAVTAAYSAGSTFAVTGSLNKGLTAGLTAAAMPGGGSAGAILASAAIGGVSSKLMGGNFGHGFFAAGLGAAAGNIGGGIRNPVGKIVISAIVGGTVSKVTGGKFANGAFSAAFSAAMRASRNSDPGFDWDGEYEVGSPEWDAREAAMADLEQEQAQTEINGMLDNGGKGLYADNVTVSQCLATCTIEYLGIETLVAGSAIYGGLPLKNKRFVMKGSSPKTSYLSDALGRTFPQKLPKRVWAPTMNNVLATSNKLGRVGARWIPVLGTGLLVYDGYQVAQCTISCMDNNTYE
ncbi:RHS repeat-associated core domain-containing protein [Pseudoalteromonas viridis]|uniref:Uncharacterized protein n=1 Tax=Pseudoalteromonas viridis TaxID=339617 RepID=A0ABX7V6Q0_9GAMM|nr:RHS repeat-associated core domain-containing protein [Pseudoalteromonas viridis]QTL36563.1 hypothetical protein J5X90_05860 [Pseudoalteromonas viridis]